MYPRETVYRFAQSDADFHAIRELTAADDDPRWPAIIAERSGRIIGSIGTTPNDDAIIVGYLFAPSSIVAMRLIEMYEATLRLMGIREYLFFLEEDAPARWRSVLNRAPDIAEPIGEQDGMMWYRRRVIYG